MLEMLNKKLAEIRDGKAKTQRQIEQATANFNAFTGAEQVVLQLIEEVRKEKEDGENANNNN